MRKRRRRERFPRRRRRGQMGRYRWRRKMWQNQMSFQRRFDDFQNISKANNVEAAFIRQTSWTCPEHGPRKLEKYINFRHIHQTRHAVCIYARRLQMTKVITAKLYHLSSLLSGGNHSSRIVAGWRVHRSEQFLVTFGFSMFLCKDWPIGVTLFSSLFSSKGIEKRKKFDSN